VVIYPTRSIEQSHHKTVQEILDSGRITRIYLDELGKIEELPTGLGLMVLTILEKNEARGLIDRSQGNKATIDLVTKIIVYKFGTLSRDEVDVMLGIKLQETRVYQDAMADGEVIGEARLVLRQLNRQVGLLPPQISERVRQLTVQQLEDLGEALLEFTGLADLEEWLSQD
jgi:predicted transposase YdaD